MQKPTSLKILFGSIMILFNIIQAEAQQLDIKQTITLSKQYYAISEVFEIFIINYNINLSYENGLDNLEGKLNFPNSVYTLKTILDEIEKQGKTIGFVIKGNNIVAIQKKIRKKYTISGFVKSTDNGEVLLGSTVYIDKSTTGTTANNYGFYSLTLPQGKYTINCTFLGFNIEHLNIDLQKDTSFIFELEPSTTSIEEVIIEGSTLEEIQKSSQMSTINIPVSSIETMPALLGETDVLKIAQLTPGVKAGTEGTGSIYVRGGGADQNLILLDGVALYNPTHILGLVSFFNSSSINNMQIIKGGFPARYGGRSSSVIDVAMKEGNNKTFKGEASIGTIMTKATLEGPLNKGKTSYLISGRRTYFDVIANPFLRYSVDDYGYSVADVNLKINHAFSNKSKLFYSFFSGDEKGFGEGHRDFKIEENTAKMRDYYGMRWGNMMSALRWNHVFSNKLFSNNTLSFSGYRFGVLKEYSITSEDISTIEDFENIDYTSEIGNIAATIDYYYAPSPNHTLRWGVEGRRQYFFPATYTLSNKQVTDSIFGPHKTFTNDFAFYAEDDFNLSDKIKINLGIRTSFLADNKNVAPYFEPRISSRFLFNQNLSCKFSYTRMTQFLHLITHFGYGVPTEIWVPATNKIKPLSSDQIVLGFAYLTEKQVEISIETYYKEMENVIEFSQEAGLYSINENWEESVEIGSGSSYGLEIFIQKKIGINTGWIGYTLSKTDRQFNNLYSGKRFPYIYDRRHDISAVLQRNFKKKHKISLAWVYGTGNAMTIPLETYDTKFFGYETVGVFSDRNSFQMRPYHRLDLNIMFNKQKKHGVRTWAFSAYNLYNRKNPIFIDYETSKRQFVEYTMLPFMPSFSYTYKF